MTRTPFLAHSVSNFSNKQVHFLPPRDLGQEAPFEARLEMPIPPVSHCREHCGVVLRCNYAAKLQSYPYPTRTIARSRRRIRRAACGSAVLLWRIVDRARAKVVHARRSETWQDVFELLLHPELLSECLILSKKLHPEWTKIRGSGQQE